MSVSNPFPSTASKPGRGIIQLNLIPPQSSTLAQVSYQYPLKLVAPAPLKAQDNVSVQTVYLLTYGGGIVAGDSIDLNVEIAENTRLILLTQGSTKIFKSPGPHIRSKQHTTVEIRPGAALCYLPDPVQPFERSCFAQRQIYKIISASEGSDRPIGSICALDWVTQGRTAAGENWNMWHYGSRNDVWLEAADLQAAGSKRLLLRDNLLLQAHASEGADAMQGNSFAEQMHGIGVYGTLILHGPVFEDLIRYFHEEFKAIPRIGARQWDAADEKAMPSSAELNRSARQSEETKDGLLWTVATLRGCTVVKFGAREVEGGKKWLRSMFGEEGTINRHFGERAMLCLK
ncbi:hypothetical protein ANO11243_043810 [Dothideomycetidae sp. 11243]|nr:hypothetical protein ANO11243_043810 [fungal sp. No.11243]